MMTNASIFMDEFMRKLENNEFQKENQPNNGPDLDDSFVKQQLASYVRVLKSGIMDAAVQK